MTLSRRGRVRWVHPDTSDIGSPFEQKVRAVLDGALNENEVPK